MMILASGEAPALSTGWSLAAAVILIIANGFFVAYEFAMIAAKRSAFEAGAEEGRRISRAAVDAMSDLSMQLAGAQLGITMATLALGYVGEPVLAAVFENVLDGRLSEDVTRVASFIVALFVVSFLHLVVGEMVPKNIAIAAPEPTVRWLVLPAKIYVGLFRPVILLLNTLANAGCRLVGVEPRDELTSSHSAAELASIFHLSFEGGGIESDSADRLRGALDFAERTVGDAARSIDETPTIRRGDTFAVAERVVAEHGVNRLPVRSITRGVTRIVGYVHAKDLLVPADQRQQPVPDALRRDMVIVRPDITLVQVLRMLKQQRLQMALVTESSGPIGVISMEEVIEALTEDRAEVADVVAGATHH
jgi:CBS domain containing-hemolysin-like protein